MSEGRPLACTSKELPEESGTSDERIDKALSKLPEGVRLEIRALIAESSFSCPLKSMSK